MTAPPSIPPSTQTQIQTQSPAARAPVVKPGLDFTSLWALYLLTLRQYQHGKRWMVMAGLALLPIGLSVLIRYIAPNVPPVAAEFIFVFMFIPQALLPLTALLYASGIVTDEQEEQTISYLLVRPIPKWALYATKLLATLTTTILLTMVFTTLTYVAIYAGADAGEVKVTAHCLRACLLHSLAVGAYCCLFGMMSLITKRILIAGIVYIVIIEGLFANLAFGIRLITVIYYTRIIAFRSMEFIILTNPTRPSENIAADAWQLDIVADPTLAEHPQIRSCLLVLLIGSVICTALAMWLCSNREFHVKTPEKA